MSRKIMVPISMDPELLEMIDDKREELNDNRSQFICGLLKFTFIKAELSSYERIIENYPEECPLQVYYDILFDYIAIKQIRDACTHEHYITLIGDLYIKWWHEGKYGNAKKYWHDRCVKEAIERILSEVQ